MKCFGGAVEKWTHASTSTNTDMTFNIFIPHSDVAGRRFPVLYFLAGLTCSEDNFIVKCGAQRYAQENGIILVAPDTSPRGAGIEGEDDDWDFGSAAGFYLTATAPKWAKHYDMSTYINVELQKIIEDNFPVVRGIKGITGHSMGGHGSLVAAFRNPDLYKSVSSFSPIAHPTKGPWGQKAFSNYLGSVEAGKEWDATELMLEKGPFPQFDILVDVGTADPWGAAGKVDELLGHDLDAAMEKKGQKHVSRRHEGYEHGYMFVGTFIEEHVKWHADRLYAAIAAKAE